MDGYHLSGRSQKWNEKTKGDYRIFTKFHVFHKISQKFMFSPGNELGSSSEEKSETDSEEKV